jgi:hypothetical protein
MITKPALALAALPLLGIAATSPAAYAANTISACGATVSTSGNYTVTGDLTTASGTPCITIITQDVAIDLQGHMITGTGSASSDGAGIADTSAPLQTVQTIIIANRTIQGFNTGIYLTSGQYATIAQMNLMRNEIGLHTGQNYVVVTDSQANKNGVGGMLFDGSFNTVNNSTANNNGEFGMEFTVCENSVSNSSANNNGKVGMGMGEGCNHSISNSTANNNGESGGIFLGNNTTVTDSQANGNKGPGIFINGSGLLSGDTANGNGAQGISVGCPSIGQLGNLFGDTAQGNTGGDIVTSGTGCARLGNKPAP